MLVNQGKTAILTISSLLLYEPNNTIILLVNTSLKKKLSHDVKLYVKKKTME